MDMTLKSYNIFLCKKNLSGLTVGVGIAQAGYQGPMTWTVKALDRPPYIQARPRPSLFLLNCFA